MSHMTVSDTEFIEFLDEIIDYDRIVEEYGLSYSEIKDRMDKLKIIHNQAD